MNQPMLNEKQASVMRKYFHEVVIYGLVIAVSGLFYLYHDLNKFIRVDQNNSNKEQMRVIERNTQTLEDIKIIFLNNSKTSK